MRGALAIVKLMAELTESPFLPVTVVNRIVIGPTRRTGISGGVRDREIQLRRARRISRDYNVSRGVERSRRAGKIGIDGIDDIANRSCWTYR